MYPGIHGQKRANHAAVVMATSGDVVTYRELDDRSSRLAHVFRDAGLVRGDHIALFMENQPRFMEVVWAAMRSGLYVTTVNSFLTAPEVAYIVEDCMAKALVTSSARSAVVVDALGYAKFDGLHLRLMCDGAVAGFDSLEEALEATQEGAIDDESSGGSMLYSSGSTGRPKGILRKLVDHMPWDNDPALEQFTTHYGYDEQMIYLSPAPMYHAAPLAYSVAVHRAGGTLVMMEKFDPVAALDLIDTHSVTHSQWVPTMFVRMLKLEEAERLGRDLSTHRVAIHAAAPCPVEVKHRMIEWWGPILYEYYAGTEGNGSTAITSEEWIRKPGSVGKSRSAEVIITNDEGHRLGPNEPGTIWFKGGGSFEYHNDPTKTAESRSGDATSTLGDVGYLDEDGYLFLTDRKAYMIISGGVNIYPQEIEDCLILHPSVADVAVFGVPDSEMGEQVKAVVQVAEGVVADDALAGELVAYSRARIAHFKCPRTVDFEAELPRLPTGKLYKRLLRDRYWGKPTSTIV